MNFHIYLGFLLIFLKFYSSSNQFYSVTGFATNIKFFKGNASELASNSPILYLSTLLLPTVRTHWHLAHNVIKKVETMKKIILPYSIFFLIKYKTKITDIWFFSFLFFPGFLGGRVD